MTSYWCEWAWLGGDQATAAVTIRTDGDRIAAVTPGSEPPPDAPRLPGITLPGLANVHSHAFHRALRGRTQQRRTGGRGSFWTWRTQMYELAARLTPENYRALATAVFAEMALAGATAVGEFHYVHHAEDGVPYSDPNAMGRALLDAAADAGIRITLLDTCYLHGGIEQHVEGVQRRFSDGSAAAWADRVSQLAGLKTATANIGAAVHSVRAVDPASTAEVAAWAAANEAPLHVHLSEQPAENEASVAAYGRTPAAVLAHAGALTPRTTAIHGTHLIALDQDLLADRGSAVCFCPTTERDLADGIGPAAQLRDAGVPLCVGSDSHAVIDLFEEARGVELDERLASGARGHFSGAELLEAATETGMHALGWDAGRIEPGRLADLTTVGLDSVRLAGIGPDHAADAIVFAATAADVTHAIVGGEIVVAEGRHRRLGDVTTLLQRALAAL